MMAFLLCFDDSKKATTEKVVAAIAAYRERFGQAPTVVITNEREYVEVAGVEVRSAEYVRPNNFWIGMVEV